MNYKPDLEVAAPHSLPCCSRWRKFLVRQAGYSLEHIAFEGKTVNRSSRLRHAPAHAVVAGMDSDDLTQQDRCEEPIPSILQAAGLSEKAYRAASMNRRLNACLRSLKATTVPEAAHLLIKHPELKEPALDALLIGVTEFFRDRPVFDALSRLIETDLPQRTGTLRVWSAGCSSGAELYSMAFLLAEAGLLHRSILLGTDCRKSAIREARAGLYSASCLQTLDPLLREKYFRKVGTQWQVLDSVRSHVRCRTQDLLSVCEKGPWDIILWRNMAIYFETNASHQIWSRITKEMRPGGLIVTGKAERPPHSIGLSTLSRSIYRREKGSGRLR